MQFRFSPLPGILSAAVLVLAASDASAETKPLNAVWAERMVEQVTPADNRYASHPTIVRWASAGEPARNRSVCSSFQTHVFERAYHLTTADITRWFGTSNPQAVDYEQAIVASRGFTQIARVTDLRPGDIIAVAYPPGSKPTGHVMMVDGPAVRRHDTAPRERGLAQYEIAVIDSSHSGHGSHDTRFADGRRDTGVGRGLLRLYANPDGTLGGYAWSTKRVSEFYPQGDRHMAFGRYSGVPTEAAALSTSDGDDVTDSQQ